MTKQSIININEGKFTVSIRTFQKEVDEPSAMADYLSESAIVTNVDDSLFLTVMLQDHKTITGFQVENDVGKLVESIDQQVNEEINCRFEMFEIGRLTSLLRARVQYEVQYEGRKIIGDEVLRLVFDKDSLEKIG